MQWGDVSFTSEPIGNFLGLKKQTVGGFLNKVKGFFKKERHMRSASIDQRDIKLQYFVNKFQKNPTEENYAALNELLNKIKTTNTAFKGIKNTFNLSGVTSSTTNFTCYKKAVAAFEGSCGKVDESNLSQMRYLFEICQSTSGYGYEHIMDKLNEAC